MCKNLKNTFFVLIIDVLWKIICAGFLPIEICLDLFTLFIFSINGLSEILAWKLWLESHCSTLSLILTYVDSVSVFCDCAHNCKVNTLDLCVFKWLLEYCLVSLRKPSSTAICVGTWLAFWTTFILFHLLIYLSISLTLFTALSDVYMCIMI